MADLARTVGILFKATDAASDVTAKVAGGLDLVGGSASGATSKVDALGKETEALGEKSKSVEVLGNALKAFAASLIVKDFIDANVAFEQFTRTMSECAGLVWPHVGVEP